jgi:hypothetical protein
VADLVETNAMGAVFAGWLRPDVGQSFNYVGAVSPSVHQARANRSFSTETKTMNEAKEWADESKGSALFC